MWNELKQSKDELEFDRNNFMINNIIKNEDGTFTIRGAMYELYEICSRHQGSIYKLNEEQGYYEITVSNSIKCVDKVTGEKISIEKYCETYFNEKVCECYSDFIYSNSEQELKFKDSNCIEIHYDAR